MGDPADSATVSREIGTLVGGRYCVEATLGRGGMGTVYRALDESTGRYVALKQLASTERRSDRLRFRREYHTLASLAHPRIVKVFEYGVDSVGAYYTMELLDGDDLRARGGIEYRKACLLLRDVASALALLHSHRLLHRDLSARNVRCTSDGHAKLLDFGVLCTVGSSGDLVGTPPYMAPEMMRGAPLDQRADLFGLGALAYWLLAGRDAFPAVRLDQVAEARKAAPDPPSLRSPEVPKELDELVLSMLTMEPQTRPSSAAEVMERLGAIAKLEPAPELDIARGYVQSAVLVGRERELAALRQRLRRTIDGHGRAIVLYGRSGVGKSRLMRELGIEAQLSGATVAHVHADDGRGPFGVMRKLAEELVSVAPGLIDLEHEGSAEILAPALPGFAPRLLSSGERRAADVEPREQRIRLQQQIADVFLGAAAQKPLVLMIDDLQRCDEASCAVLAVLASEARTRPLLVCATLRLDEECLSESAVEAFSSLAQRVRLGGLAEEAVEELVRGIFGDVPNIAALAHYVRRAAGGTPLSCTELIRHLVDDGVIAYRDGMWVIPHSFDRFRLPGDLVRAMDARVASLGTGARSLGAVLSVHGGDIPLEACVTLAETGDEAAVFAALDELVREEVLLGDGNVFRFRHDGLREALARSLDEATRSRLHLRVGRALMAGGEISAEREAEIGWHLLRGGASDEAADLLHRAGMRLFDATSFRDAIPPLEAALRVLERRDPDAFEVAELKFTLTAAGMTCDPLVVRRHGDDAIRLLSHHAGVQRIRDAQRKLGLHIGLATTLAADVARYRLKPKHKRAKRPIDMLRMYVRSVLFTAAISISTLDVDRLDWLATCLEPFAAFRSGNGFGAYRLVCMLRDYTRGHFGAVRSASETLIEETLARSGPTSPAERMAFLGAIRFVHALTTSLEGRPGAAIEIANLESSGVRMWAVGALELRLRHALGRGEEAKARDVQARLELEYTRLGSAWQAEISLPSSAAIAYAYLGDVLGLKRCIELLSAIPSPTRFTAMHTEIARAEYMRLRGELPAAETALIDVLARLGEEPMLSKTWALATLADVLFARGDLGRAREAAERCIKLTDDPRTMQWNTAMRAKRTLAMVLAAAGDQTTARNLVLRIIAEAEESQNPAVLGYTHETAARLARIAGADTDFEHHRAHAEVWFRSTDNPVLMARADRLGREVRESLVPEKSFDDSEAMTVVDASDRSLESLLSGCRDATERSHRALEVIVGESQAIAGYLFLATLDDVRCVASHDGTEPSETLVKAAKRTMETAIRGSRWGDREREEGYDYHPFALITDEEGTLRPVGCAVLRAGTKPLVRPPLSMLDGIARAFVEMGDVRSLSSPLTVMESSYDSEDLSSEENENVLRAMQEELRKV